jgi:hypothetical protein
MADLGTVSFLIDIKGQPLVKELATDFDRVTVSEKKMSDATAKVMADFQRMKSIMQMVKTETDGAANSFQRFSAKELQQTAQRMQGFESALANTRRGMGQMGMATQQVGYQVGDFLVQVQSGTNWMVAFGQQATQLVGILPSFAGALGMSVSSLIGISAGLGIAIPLLTAFGAWWMRTGESANKAKEELSDLDTAIKRIDETLKEWVQTKQAAAAGMTVDEMFGGQSLEQAKADLATAQKALAEFTAQSSVNNIGQGGAAAGIALSDWLIGTLNQNDVDAAEKAVADAAERVAEIQAKLAEDQKAAYGEQYASLMQNYAMEKTIATFGSDSAEVKKLELRQALDDYNRQIDAQIKSNEISVAQGDALKLINRQGQDAVDLQQKETDALNRGKELAREFLSTYLDIGKAVDDISKVDLKSVFEDVLPPSSALYQFVSDTYTTMLNMSKFQPRDYSGFTYGGALAESRTGGPSTPPEIKGTTTTGGLGGGGAAKVDPLIELQKQIALQEELNGKTEAERQVRQALGDDYAKYSPTIINGLEEQIQKQIELEERLKEQQGLYDTIQSSMEDAFMSMVDGTQSAKDAFKSMAAAIIKELYNVLVVQQLVGSFDRATGKGAGITGFLGKALTGMFKADGGPVSAGQPYIVGERGPELIIPKSSGMVLTNGQTKAALGGSSNESYVVNNNISVTGSDSAMVRQEIAKMIPQISSATKAAMIDAKRRGGQMGNAFR